MRLWLSLDFRLSPGMLLSQPQEENEVIAAVLTFLEIECQTKLQDLITPASWELFKILNLLSDWLLRPLRLSTLPMAG